MKMKTMSDGFPSKSLDQRVTELEGKVDILWEFVKFYQRLLAKDGDED